MFKVLLSCARAAVVPALLTGLWVAAGPARALDVKSGLWASASSTTVDGKPQPSSFERDSGLSASEVREVRAAMREAGLPEGWEPQLICVKAGGLDPQAALRELGPHGCHAEALQPGREALKYAVRCKGPDSSGNGQGEVTVRQGSESRGVLRVSLVHQGRPLRYEQQWVGKWLGADCQHPPAGIDPAWVEGAPDGAAAGR